MRSNTAGDMEFTDTKRIFKRVVLPKIILQQRYKIGMSEFSVLNKRGSSHKKHSFTSEQQTKHVTGLHVKIWQTE